MLKLRSTRDFVRTFFRGTWEEVLQQKLKRNISGASRRLTAFGEATGDQVVHNIL